MNNEVDTECKTCTACNGDGFITVSGVGSEAGCCGNILSNGECCGNAIEIQVEIPVQQVCECRVIEDE